MSNQIVISSGAKVRSLEGVLTGTAGIVNSVPLGGANGVATLDSNGKVPLSQLPASVVTYLGTWNAATNTPTLANGTGDIGDLYICNVAGTVNFGAGPITFAVSDWVIYNGSEWQKSSGASGTVTSVAVTSTGNDAISITGSPITTAGTINIGFTGDNTQYINGAGDLTTFPSLTGYVPYTGATTDVDLGVHVLNAQALHVKGTAGAGHLGLKHQSAAATGSANESLIYANVDGDLAWQNDNLYLTTLSTHANTANRVYTFPNASGTIALTSDISYPVTSVFGRTGAVTAQSGDYTTTQVTEGTNLYYTDARARGAISLTTTGTSGAATYNSTTGVFNIPNYGSALSGYVPYTGATTDVNLGYRSISASNINIDGYSFGDGGAINFKQFTSLSLAGTGYTSIGANSTNILTFGFNQGSLNLKGFKLDVAGLTTNVWRTYTMPNADGTIALTSDIPSLANYVTLTGTQTITGVKTFSNEQLFGNGLTINGGYITFADSGFSSTLDTTTLTASRAILLPNASGTLALTSDIPSLSGYVPYTGATADVNLGTTYSLNGYKIGLYNGSSYTNIYGNADGISINFGTYVNRFYFNNSNRTFTFPDATGTLVLGSGTTNYLPKFTGASTIGNSLIYDNGTNVAIGGTTMSSIFNLNGTDPLISFQNAGSTKWQVGLENTASNRFVWYDNTAAAYRMVINSSGNIGIGTTSPARQFEIYNANDAFMKFNGARAGNAAITVGTESAGFVVYDDTNSAYRLVIKQNGNVGIGTSSPSTPLYVVGSMKSETGLYFNNATTNGAFVWQEANTPLRFATNDTERMRITSGGYTKMSSDGTYYSSVGNYHEMSSNQSDTNTAVIRNKSASPYGPWINFSAAAPNNTTNHWLECTDNGGHYYYINSNATISSSSDRRLKKNIVDATPKLNSLMQLRVVNYEWITSINGTKELGLIAQEVEEIFPNLVETRPIIKEREVTQEDGTIIIEQYEDGDTKGIKHSVLPFMLLKALQEANTKIEELSAKVTALENKS